MVIQNIDYPNYQALKRLIVNKFPNGNISDQELQKLSLLASEHGISKEEVVELLDLLDMG
ncbi:hypothetical protein [Marinoscillum sp.]|uniref:hypothetical protein n=1 Tax=Marinoscillum sp. TaxID=2024838 RepID=UPI003BAA0460